MVLCAGIIEDWLGREVLFKSFISTDNPFVLERAEVYRGGGIFSACVLYLARAGDLPAAFTAREGAALICIGMPPESYRRSSLHVLALDPSTELMDLVNDVSRVFFEFNTLEQKLQDSVNKGRSIQYMVEQMAPYFGGNELLICNDDFRIIGQSNKVLHLNEISGLGQPDDNGILPQEIVTFFKNDVIFAEIRNLREPFVYESSIFLCRAIDMNVFRQGEYVCRVVVAEDRNPFRGYEAGLLRFFTGFIQLVYDLTADSGDIIPGDHLADIFIDLLSGESVEEHRLEKSFLRRGWRLTGPFMCASVMPSERDYYNRTIAYYCRTFNRDIKGCCFFEYEDAVVSVINLAEYDNSPELFAARTIETFRDGYFRIGYSNSFSNISELRSFFLQAKIALRLGIGQSPSIWFHRFSNVVLPYIRSKLTEDLDGRYLCAPEILLLRDYDRENGTELLRTLRQYVNNQLNAVRTAGDLFIHRSTMMYRLDRIRELTGIDFRDPDRTLYLSVSLNLLLTPGEI